MKKFSSPIVQQIAWWLVIIGAVNWGLVGIGYFANIRLNIVNLILGNWPFVEFLVYLVVGISAVVVLVTKTCNCGHCDAEAPKINNPFPGQRM